MIPYVRSPDRVLTIDGVEVASFVGPALNADARTVQSFGEEWTRFGTFTAEETRVAGDEVFDLLTPEMAHAGTVALDLGCGTGRWSNYLAPRVRFIEAIDPGRPVEAAVRLTRGAPNIRVTQAGYGALPFAPDSFDLVFSLGVVHHLPDTETAIREAASRVKPGGWLLLYIYYALDNRGAAYRALFRLADLGRRLISRLPSAARFVACDAIALGVYLPFIGLARLVRAAGSGAWRRVPLAYYVGKPWTIVRSDALDRFGTPLEKRYTREAIRGMLERAGLAEIRFSEGQPYWHVVARRGKIRFLDGHEA
jgi:SAM-dependent methyltransferase